MADTTRGSDGATVGTDRNGRVLTVVGFVLAGLALFFLPIVLGPVGALLGFLGLRKGDPLGKWAIVAGIAATIIGIALSAALMSAITNG